MKQFLIFIIVLISTVGFSQNEANIWYFGVNAGLDFNSGTPVALTDGILTTIGGMATISDSSGNLLFYTDSSVVINRNHNYMPNADILGIPLNGCPLTTQAAIIVPWPGNANQYFIFTLGCEAQPNGLQYSVVDMTLDGGLGDVTTKNVPLRTPMTEKLTAVQSTSFNGYWLISHDWGNNQFVAYRITSAGVDTNAVISSVGEVIDGNVINAQGQMKVSPDGSKLAIATEGNINLVQLFDFNPNTGAITNPQTIIDEDSSTSLYGIEFSPSGDKLYVSGFENGVYQYDLTAGSLSDIIASEYQVTTLIRGYRSLQLGVDGKIYIVKEGESNLDYIGNPEGNPGIDLGFVFQGVDLLGRRGFRGLPPFIQSFFHVGFQTENICEGNTTQFNANISQGYDSLIWDFGDGNISIVENPQHTYTTAGTYNVILTVASGTKSSTDIQNITIYEQPIATQPQDIMMCDNDNDGFYGFDLTTQDSDILNGQSSSVFDVTYYASMMDYTNDNPITDPNNYANTIAYTSQTIVANITNINNMDCEDTTTFNIQVFESPTPSTNIPNISFCDNTSVGTDTDGMIEFDLTQNESVILNGQSATDFAVSYFADSALTNQINDPSVYQNASPTETIYVQVVNNNYSSCIAQTSFDIEVFELPTVTTVVTLSQCDDDLDGFSIFNLTEVNAELSTNHLNEVITFYETQIDAENANSPITNDITYTNQTVSTDMVWARIENANNCHRTAQVDLIVSTTQIPNTYTRNFYQCDDGTDTDDGISTFDFSMVNTEIQALFPVGQQLIINYYRNQADALSETNPIVDITNYQNIAYPYQQGVFIRVDSALDNDCLGLGHHITLNVETIPVAHPVIIDEQCDNDGDEMFAFDTSSIETTLLNGQTNVSIEYFDDMGNNLPSPLSNPFLTASQTITARVTNTTTQDPDGACYDETQIMLTVDAAAVAHTVPDFIECDDNGDGQFAFNTSNIEATVLNGQTGMIVTYTDEDGNSLPSPLSNPFTIDTQTITVRVENLLSTICFDETTINFIVSEQPIANPISNDFVCDDVSNDGEYTFTLSDYDSQILNGQSQTTFEVFYFENNSDAQNNINALLNSYVVNSTSQTLFTRIQNSSNTDCFDITSFELGVHYLPIANQPEDILVCDDETNDGIETFSLGIQNTSILNGQSNIDNTSTYHLSQVDAENNTSTISEDFTNTENPQTIYVRLENNNYSDCYTTTSFQIIVNQQPVLEMQDQWPICEGDTVEIIADTGYDEYLWSTGETSQTITVDTAGTYEVIVTNVYGALRCETSKTVTVANSNIATITNIETVDWTQNNNTITIFVDGNGDYEYSIDNVNYQESNEFKNLIVDEYTVYIRDKNGCGIVSESVYLLNYPKFFTPNNDGNNDTWQLVNSIQEPNNKIYIYDRYGKLLKQLSPTGLGWNGTINGVRLASDDYWFVLERQNGKIYKGHFTLKR